MTAQPSQQSRPFRLEEATIEELHAAIRRGRRPASRSCSTTSTACAPTTGSPACSSPKTAPRSPKRPGAVRAQAPLRFPTADRQGLHGPARSRQVQGAAARIRPHGGDGFRSCRAAAVRDDRRHAACRAGECARHPQHPRRAFGHLPRRLRPASVRGAAASRRTPRVRGCFAGFPTRSSARPSSTRRMDAIPISRRCRCMASSSRSRIRSTRRTCDPPAAATRATTSISRRAITCWSSSSATRARSSSPRPSTRNTTGGRAIPAAATRPTRCCRRRSAISAAPGAAIPPTPTTRHASASLGSSSGSGVSVSTNLVMASLGEETRASCRGPANHNAVALILPHKSMLGFNGGAIGADIYCDRSGILCRTIADCAKVLDALKDPVDGYYDPRDPYTTVPRSSVLSTPYASHARMPGDARRAHGHAPRHHPGVDGVPAGLEDRGADRHRRRAGRSRRSSATGWGRRSWSRPIRCGSTDPDIETMTDGFPARAGQARARVHARPAVQAGARRTAAVPGVRGGDRADRVHARQDLRHGHHAADRLLRRAGGGTDRAALRTSTSPPSRSRSWRWRSGSTSRST